MNNTTFNKVVNERINKIKTTLAKKGKEYSGNNSDRLINFAIAANMQGVSRKRALMGMLAKHLASIEFMIRTDSQASKDVWNEKIGDAINYFILLEAMVYEEIEDSNEKIQ